MMQASREPIAIDFVYKQNSLIYDALESRGPDGRYGAATAEQRRTLAPRQRAPRLWQEQYRPAAKIPFLEDNPYLDAGVQFWPLLVLRSNTVRIARAAPAQAAIIRACHGWMGRRGRSERARRRCPCARRRCSTWLGRQSLAGMDTSATLRSSLWDRSPTPAT